ncbi:hypothetical protein PIROE2DRAFT_18103 [Piromyces sp. E2]|nr:hypothetical protein PIROE2DRAFT_18103 [Piromyces sp. E2]|eukprot:OUM57036.1 hypothetical protein PIROE2DRAFT_18103 [Piromyces sp. E2]
MKRTTPENPFSSQSCLDTIPIMKFSLFTSRCYQRRNIPTRLSKQWMALKRIITLLPSSVIELPGIDNFTNCIYNVEETKFSYPWLHNEENPEKYNVNGAGPMVHPSLLTILITNLIIAFFNRR